jgi:hypothetical protein
MNQVRKDFFISYTKTDAEWAKWIAWVLEENGFSVIVQAWDFIPGSNFVVGMARAASEANHTLAVISPDYLRVFFRKRRMASGFRKRPYLAILQSSKLTL